MCASEDLQQRTHKQSCKFEEFILSKSSDIQPLYKGHTFRSQNIFSLYFQYILDFPMKDNLLTKGEITVPKCPLFGDSTA